MAALFGVLRAALQGKIQGDAGGGDVGAVAVVADGVDAIAAAEGVNAGPDLDQVVAALAVDDVVARGAGSVGAAPQPVVAAITDQGVAEVGAGNLLDADQDIHAVAGILGRTLKA